MADLIDLEKIVKSQAWNNFLESKSKDAGKLKLRDVNMNINWSHVRFQLQKEPEFTEKVLTEVPKSQVVFKSTFRNDTDVPQEHSFKTERTTTCVSTTMLTKGYTKGVNLELKLALPAEVAEITAGFGREVSMEKGFEDTKEESLTWAVDSTITVPENHSTTAEMVVKEKEFSSKFKMTVGIRGVVVVSILNKKDNNSFIQSFEDEISQILEEEFERTSTPAGCKIQGRTVVWEIEGKCSFRFGVEQEIQLAQEDLKKAES